MSENIDDKVVQDFGKEWSSFDYIETPEEELQEIFDSYFDIFPWDSLPKLAVGFDLGCGSGRWAKIVAPRVDVLYCIDPSPEALGVAKNNLKEHPNCSFFQASVDEIPLADESVDFGYSLGVLHHIPNTAYGIKECVSKLREGAPFLIYLYYSLDNKPLLYRGIWFVTDGLRKIVSSFPFPVKYCVSQLIALTIYLPLARLSLILKSLGFRVEALPLSYYSNKSLYVMRTDALDRFGTRLEKRFSAKEIRHMLETAGLEKITFSMHAPYWCAVGYKKSI